MLACTNIVWNSFKRTGRLSKSDSHIPKKICVTCFHESLLKMMKNAFYFMLKALFILKVFKFLSWYFGHVGKTAWLER